MLSALKYLRIEGTVFALQIARPSRGSDEHVETQVPQAHELELLLHNWNIIGLCIGIWAIVI